MKAISIFDVTEDMLPVRAPYRPVTGGDRLSWSFSHSTRPTRHAGRRRLEPVTAAIRTGSLTLSTTYGGCVRDAVSISASAHMQVSVSASTVLRLNSALRRDVILVRDGHTPRRGALIRLQCTNS